MRFFLLSSVGGFSAAITTPFDVAKTRIILYSQSHGTSVAPLLTVPSVAETLRTVYRGEGIKG